jgi:hypothetical protein
MRWTTTALLSAALWFALPASSYAQGFTDRTDEPPAILSYSLHGFWTGAQVGLAAGYLSTGDEYESSEWTKLALGASIGAVSGIGVGLLLGTADHAGDPPGTGYYVMRGMGYGTTVGLLGGAAVGTVMWLADESSKNIPVGASIGALAGAGLGIIFGLVEGANASRTRADGGAPRAEAGEGLRFTLAAPPRGFIPVPTIMARL